MGSVVWDSGELARAVGASQEHALLYISGPFPKRQKAGAVQDLADIP